MFLNERKTMNKNHTKYHNLMIFLLLMLVLPFTFITQNAHGQKQAQQYEEQVLLQLNSTTYDLSSEKANSVDLSDNFKWNAGMLSENDEIQFSDLDNSNYIHLFMTGQGNQAEVKQENGTGNAMDLGIMGHSNNAKYLQQGSNNYLYDRVNGNGITREVTQQGNELGVYNQGAQALPMIINQKGHGMKIKITGPPNE
jgi:hypothetical protein